MKDITGERFGMLVAIAPLKKVGTNWHWLLECDCGAVCCKPPSRLLAAKKLGRTPHCGCQTSRLSAEARAKGAGNLKHGMRKHRAYRIWGSMRNRCSSQSNLEYKNYGGRGIKVCPEWQASFEAFWADMGPTYSPGLQIDRINNDGNYEPGNCRWATSKQNSRNRRNNRVLETPWGMLTMTEAAEIAGINVGTLWTRLDKGWDSMSAVTTPVGGIA